jgi:hypothetical protein
MLDRTVGLALRKGIVYIHGIDELDVDDLADEFNHESGLLIDAIRANEPRRTDTFHSADLGMFMQLGPPLALLIALWMLRNRPTPLSKEKKITVTGTTANGSELTIKLETREFVDKDSGPALIEAILKKLIALV